MKTVNDDNLKFAFFVGRVPPRPLTATFVVKVAFKMMPGGVAELLPEDKQPEFSGDEPDSDPAQGLRYASDFALYKPGADLLLAGHCHAPAGKSYQQAEVVFGVGDNIKRLVVFGDRFWKKGGLGSSMSEPEPFDSIPLTWGRSFGGPGDPRNPVGRGIGESELEDGTKAYRLPNIETLKSLVHTPQDRPAPVGFGPIDPAAPLRASKTGTYNKKWLEQNWPWLPDDFDWSFFNAAPPDQQLQGRFLKGDELLRFDGLHPQVMSYQCRLPAEQVRLFVRRRKGDVLVFENVDLRLDTLFADMDAEVVTLLWRGVTAADSMKLKEFEEVFVVREPLARPAATSLEGYEKLYLKRTAEITKAEATVFKPIDPIVVIPPRLPKTAWADRLREKVAALPLIVPDDPDHPMEAEWQSAMGAARPVGKMPPPPKIENLAQGVAVIKAELARLEAAEPGVAQVFSNVPLDFATFDDDVAEDEKNMTPGANDEIEDEEEGETDWSRERVEKHVAAGGAFDGQDLSGLDLSQLNFSGLSFREAVLDETQLAGCKFDGADLTDASLAKATLSDATFQKANLENADFTEVIASGTRWAAANVTSTEFGGAKLAKADFKGCKGRQSGFAGCDLAGANFEDCELDQPDFTGASLAGGNFRNAVLPDAGFYEILAPDANFEGAHILRGRFSDAQLMNSNFKGCVMDEAVLENARLGRSNFTEARLARAIFTGARLSQAVFLMAHCVNAKFEDSDASRVQFAQTNLFRATFENSNLTEAVFWGSNCYEVEFFQAILKGTAFDETNLKGTKLV